MGEDLGGELVQAVDVEGGAHGEDQPVGAGVAVRADAVHDLADRPGQHARRHEVRHLSELRLEIVDRVGEYRDAGADWLILAMRAPFDLDGLDQFAAEVLPLIS